MLLLDANTIARYQCVRDPLQNTLSTAEEEIFIDFTSSGDIKRKLCKKSFTQFCAGEDDEFSALKTKAVSYITN